VSIPSDETEPKDNTDDSANTDTSTTEPTTPDDDQTNTNPDTDGDSSTDPPVVQSSSLESTPADDWDEAFLIEHNKIRQDPKSLIPSLEAIIKDFEYSTVPNTRKARVNG
jgi:hypothetical protein